MATNEKPLEFRKELITITEHTNGSEVYCEIASKGRPTGEFYGSIEEFEAEVDSDRFEIVEYIYS